MKQTVETVSFSPPASETWFDPTEDRPRANVRATIEAVFEEELAGCLGRLPYRRGNSPVRPASRDEGGAMMMQGMIGVDVSKDGPDTWQAGTGDHWQFADDAPG